MNEQERMVEHDRRMKKFTWVMAVVMLATGVELAAFAHFGLFKQFGTTIFIAILFAEIVAVSIIGFIHYRQMVPGRKDQ